jgi:ubiquinone/menaquinone biosynthesis C-methylase UbiE
MQEISENANSTQGSYDRLADEFARRFMSEYDDRPFDREILDGFAERVAGKGRVCDLGCGPGQLARYMHKRGVDVFGIDLSSKMVEEARRANPGIEFEQGDMRDLNIQSNSLAGIAAMYCIIHIARADVTGVLRELRRVLQPGGLLLLVFQIGDQTMHRDEWWGRAVSIDFTFFSSDEMAGYLRAAGFMVEEIKEREPYTDGGSTRQVAYLLASKPRGSRQCS